MTSSCLRPFRDFFLELFRARLQGVVGALDGDVAALDLVQHRVEAVDQRANLVVLRLLHTQ